MTTNVLLTGASGFVGRQILRDLNEQCANVKLVLRDSSRLTESEIRKASIVRTDDMFTKNEIWWKNVCAGIDVVIHAAWYVNPEDYLYADQNKTCTSGTISLAKGALLAGVKKFIGLGTCFEYDLSQKVPLDVSSDLKPITPYAKAKRLTFDALTQLFSTSATQFAWCRLFYLYGDNEAPQRLYPYLNKAFLMNTPAILSDGSQVRDYLDVQIAGAQITGIAFNDAVGPLNICSGKAITVRQFAEHIADRYGKRNLLVFNKTDPKKYDPPFVVGIPSTF